MDFLAMGICALLGLTCYLFVALIRAPKPGMAFQFFTWGLAVPWLTIAALYQLLRANAYDVGVWTGEASLDLGSFILAFIGVCIVGAGSERGHHVQSDSKR